MKELFIGIDVGTQSVRGIIVDGEGSVIFAARETLQPDFGLQFKAEEDVNVIWQALCRIVQRLTANCGSSNIAAIGICTTNPTLIIADKALSPLFPATLWVDNRVSVDTELREELQKIRNSFPESSLQLISKLLWFSKHYSLEQAEHVLECSSWLAWRLTGQLSVSSAIASLSWGVPPNKWQDFSSTWERVEPWVGKINTQIHLPTAQVGWLHSEAKIALGLSNLNSQIALFVPGNDGLTHAVGAGLCSDDIFGVEVGGSSYVSFKSNLVDVHPDNVLNAPNALRIGCLDTAGLFLEWVRKISCLDDVNAFQEACSKAMLSITSDASKCLVIPADTLCLNIDSKAGICINGISLGDDIISIISSILQTVAYWGAKQASQYLTGAIVLSGGFSSNPAFVSIRAAVSAVLSPKIDVLAALDPHCGCRGAAAVAVSAITGNANAYRDLRPEFRRISGDLNLGKRVCSNMYT